VAGSEALGHPMSGSPAENSVNRTANSYFASTPIDHLAKRTFEARSPTSHLRDVVVKRRHFVFGTAVLSLQTRKRRWSRLLSVPNCMIVCAVDRGDVSAALTSRFQRAMVFPRRFVVTSTSTASLVAPRMICITRLVQRRAAPKRPLNRFNR